MTKRSLENDIEALNQEVLGDLSHDERLELLLEANANRKDSWRERLAETAPRAIYEQMEVGLTRRVEVSYTMGQTATVHLQSSALRYLWASSVFEYSAQVTLADEELPPHPLVSMDDFDPTEFLVELYVTTDAYRRFATEDLGVSLETWLAGVPEGASVVASATDILDAEADRLQRLQDDSEPLLGVAADLPDDFDAAIDERYTIISDFYNDVLGT
ncbi:hypothetical protein [Halococcus qingdaonensis]|uniref:hypothetical protein n=1 Tax=Halococcus qingdaonensis TaxID=224402 RepID=UPI002115D954|nr:hypothetical protein [Halococcus qingdaonensis]